jgi:hypothetical protein
LVAFGWQNQTMRLTEENIAREASRLASFDRTPLGKLRRRLTRIAVRTARVILGALLIVCFLMLIDNLQATPDSFTEPDSGTDSLMVALAVAGGSAAVAAAWFIALGHAPTSAEVLQRRHARARRSIQWRRRMGRLRQSYPRLAAPGVWLTRGLPVLGLGLAVGWLSLPGKSVPGNAALVNAPAAVTPGVIASEPPTLRMTIALLTGGRSSQVSGGPEMLTTPLSLRMDSKFRVARR